MSSIELFKILSDKNRLRILNLLYGRELCVCELGYLLEISQSNLSKHLRLMSAMDFLKNRRENKFIYYRINEMILKAHPFLEKVFEEELVQEAIFKEGLDKFRQYKASGLTCKNLSALI